VFDQASSDTDKNDVLAGMTTPETDEPPTTDERGMRASVALMRRISHNIERHKESR
jgi:hypothetical protein